MEVRDKIAKAALAVARHIHDGGYSGVIVSGRSNQLSRALLALGWSVLYPGEPLKKVFVLDGEANRLLYKSHGVSMYPSEFESRMHESLPELEAAKNDRLCFVDDFALSGEKLRGASAALGMLGFTGVDFAYYAALEDTELGDSFVGVRSAEAVGELRHLGEHIQGREDAAELLDDITPSMRELRGQALDEIRDIGGRMK